MRGSTQPPAAGVHAVHTAQSNFTRCTARFDGAACNADVVEAFIESVLVYKECAGVSDDHALRGLPMLLTGDAAVWWRGVRPTVESWDDALRRLRFMYGAARPAHRVLRDIFATEQQSESADVYISRVRANISRLPYPLPEQMQLDIVYGLLHRRIRKRVPRDSVSSVDCLLERARYVEEMLGEANQCSTSSHNSNTANTNLRDKDNPSNATGKNINPQTAAVKNVNPQTTTSDSSSNIDSSSATSKRVRPRCARCKRFGHTMDECKSKGNELACYGCGREGVIRSKCPTCKGKCKEDAPAAAADGKVSFQSAYTHDSSTSQPTINIEVASLLGVAVLDTGATESLASPGLYAILLKNGTSFTSARRTIGLADGTQHTRDVLLCDTNVVVRGRIVPTTFIVIPGAENRTLLGQDFITKSGILLDLQRGCWYFSDSTKVKVPFVRSYSLMSTSDAELMQVNTTGLALRENEGSKLAPTDVRDNQLKDPELKTIVEDLEDSDPSRGRGWSERGYLMSDGVLYRDVHEQAQSIRKKYADEGRRTPPDYKVGDLVLLKTQSMNDAGRGQTAKFIPRRDGPYRIREVVSPTTYVIEGLTRAEHIGRYHVSHLRPFVGDIVSPVREKRKRGRPLRTRGRYVRTRGGVCSENIIRRVVYVLCYNENIIRRVGYALRALTQAAAFPPLLTSPVGPTRP
ncbi:hypothetical protein SFRURICE_016855 [Spodoptera frugiperda]|nr:hypothetical protein SFRURICE_016855 [Spodoptera frugiperda]